MAMSLSDNISRFPYSGPRGAIPVEPLGEAQLAERRAEWLERMTAALPGARAAVAAEARAIIARMREGRRR
jgi:hypothetical protein